jgi:large repetitive protein
MPNPRSSSPRLARGAVVLVLGAAALASVSSSAATFSASASTGSAMFTTRAACSAGTGYPAAVEALGPTFYYRFGDPAGSGTVADSSGNGNTGLVRDSSPAAGVALPLALGVAGTGLIWCDTTDGMVSPGTPGVLGSGSFVVWPVARPNPNTFTIMAWVRTASVTGGRVIGMSSSTWALDVHFDRQIVIDDAGHARFELYPGFRYTLTSTRALNDGAPHFLVATLGPAGAALYVDGVLDQSDPTRTTAETYTNNEQRIPPPPPGGSGGATPDGQGYWRVGWDNINGWGATDFGLDGVVDEAALFEGRQLTAADVAGLWATNHW